ncbi:hypothetical protein EMN47_06530 [Prolixibacteraceae bacterium JC049]|nr:hypothetical protein [Prolixibacteraceae bacterium JC049]
MLKEDLIQLESGNIVSMWDGAKKCLNSNDLKIELDTPISSDDLFLYTTLMAPTIPNPFELKRRRNLVEMWAKSAPHLVLPRKTIVFSSKRQWGAIKLHDWILKNTDYDKTRLLDTKSFEDFSQFNAEDFPQALFTTEYRVNYSRFCIELAKVTQQNSIQFDVKQQQTTNATNYYVVKDFTPNNRNDIRLLTDESDIILINKEDRLYVFPVKIENDKVLLSEIQKLIPSVKELFPIEKPHFAQYSFESIYSLHAQKESTKQNNIPIEGAPSGIEMYDYRALQDLCDEKFDIAKQTGIEFPDFSKLFFRYGLQIDEMTDMAYEMLSSTRDAKIIWQTCENEFQNKYESKIISR